MEDIINTNTNINNINITSINTNIINKSRNINTNISNKSRNINTSSKYIYSIDIKKDLNKSEFEKIMLDAYIAYG